MSDALVCKLKSLINEYECSCSPPPLVCPPMSQPCATVCMICPPPILAPTKPEPVKPLMLPCPKPPDDPTKMTEEEAEKTRYSNFYNNYNIDWHCEQVVRPDCHPFKDPRKDRCKGVTLNGKNPCCEDYRLKKNVEQEDKGCPRGFKPCQMKLFPPQGCHPCGVWCAEIQPCPPKPKKKVSRYKPGPCRRPCCKHWKSKEGDCKYDEPCKAHCYNHPPGIKPRKNIY